jgi:hypothetical protein
MGHDNGNRLQLVVVLRCFCIGALALASPAGAESSTDQVVLNKPIALQSERPTVHRSTTLEPAMSAEIDYISPQSRQLLPTK